MFINFVTLLRARLSQACDETLEAFITRKRKEYGAAVRRLPEVMQVR